MEFKIRVSPRAIKEIEQAINYFALYDNVAPKKFYESLTKAFQFLESNPFFGIYYKNVRMLNLKTYPYSLFFTINEKLKIVRILSCFHQKIDPKKLPLF